MVLLETACEGVLPLLDDDRGEGYLELVFVLLQDFVNAPLELLRRTLQNQVVGTFPSRQLLVLFDFLLDAGF